MTLEERLKAAKATGRKNDASGNAMGGTTKRGSVSDRIAAAQATSRKNTAQTSGPTVSAQNGQNKSSTPSAKKTGTTTTTLLPMKDKASTREWVSETVSKGAKKASMDRMEQSFASAAAMTPTKQRQADRKASLDAMTEASRKRKAAADSKGSAQEEKDKAEKDFRNAQDRTEETARYGKPKGRSLGESFLMGAENDIAYIAGGAQKALGAVGGVTYPVLSAAAKTIGGGDNAVSRWADEMADASQTNAFTNNWKASIQRRYQPTETEQTVLDVTGGIAEMLPFLAVSAGAGLVAGAAAKGTAALNAAQTAERGQRAAQLLMALQGMGGGAAEARSEGASVGQANLYGAADGLLGAATERISGGLPMLGNGLIDKALQKAPGVVRTAADIAGEGLEEALQTAGEPYLKRAIYDPDAQNATAEELARSAAMGSISSAALKLGIEAPQAISRRIDAARDTSPKPLIPNAASGMGYPYSEVGYDGTRYDAGTESQTETPRTWNGDEAKLLAQATAERAKSEAGAKWDQTVEALARKGKGRVGAETLQSTFRSLYDSADESGRQGLLDAYARMAQDSRWTWDEDGTAWRHDLTKGKNGSLPDPSAPLTSENLDDRKANAVSFDHPELRPYIVSAAGQMKADLADTQRGERYYTYNNGRDVWTGAKRSTSPDIAAVLDGDQFGARMDYGAIAAGLDDLIADHGRENTLRAKRMESVLIDRLTDGSRSPDGHEVPPSGQFVDHWNAIDAEQTYGADSPEARAARDHLADTRSLMESEPPMSDTEDFSPYEYRMDERGADIDETGIQPASYREGRTPVELPTRRQAEAEALPEPGRQAERRTAAPEAETQAVQPAGHKRTGGRDIPLYNEMPEGWKRTEGAQTAPRGYAWIDNGESRYSGKRQTGLIFLDALERPEMGRYQRESGPSPESSVGAAAKGFDPWSSFLGTKDKFYPEGPNAARPVDIPTTDADGDPVRKSAATITGAKAVSDETAGMVQEMVRQGRFSYEKNGDARSVQRARSTIQEKGFQRSMEQYADAVRRGVVSKDMVTLGQQLLVDASNAGDAKATAELLTLYGASSTSAAQAMQAQAILRKLTPEGQMYAIQRTVQELNKSVQPTLEKRAAKEAKKAEKKAKRAERMEKLLPGADGGVERGVEQSVQSARDEALQNIQKAADGKTGQRSAERPERGSRDWVQMMGEALSKRAEGRAADKTAKAPDPDKVILSDLTKFMEQYVPEGETIGEQPKRTAADRLRDYFSGRTDYDAAWEKAQDALRKKYSGDSVMSERLDEFIRRYPQDKALQANSVMMRAVGETVKETGQDKKVLTMRNSLDRMTLQQEVGDRLVEAAKAAGNDAKTIREGVTRWLDDRYPVDDAAISDTIDRDIRRLLREDRQTFDKLLDADTDTVDRYRDTAGWTLAKEYGVRDKTNVLDKVNERFDAQMEEARAKREHRIGEQTARAAESRATEGQLRQKRDDQRIAEDLRAFVNEAVEDRKGPGQTRRTATDRIRDYLADRDRYDAAWKQAQGELREKYKDDRTMLDRLDQFLTDTPTMLSDAVKEAVKAEDLSRDQMTVRDELDRDAMARQVSDRIIRDTGASDGADQDRIRTAVDQYLTGRREQESWTAGTVIDRDIRSAMKDIGVKMSDLIRESGGVKSDTAERIAGMLTKDYGISAEEAQAVAARVTDQFRAQVEESARRKVESLFKDRPERVQKSALQRFEELGNMGAFDGDYAQKASERVTGIEDITISQDLVEKFLKADGQEARDAVMEEIYQHVADQVPSTWTDKFRAWRYLSMLSAPRTHGRNIIGNVGGQGMRIGKDLIASGLEAAVDKISGGKLERTKTYLASPELYKLAWDDFKNVSEAVGGTKYDDMKGQIRDRMTVFDKGLPTKAAEKVVQTVRGDKDFSFQHGAMEAMRRFNSDALSGEDTLFKRTTYSDALARFLSANKMTAEQMRNGTVDADLLARGRDYSAREAMRATFNDKNDFSDMVSSVGRGLMDSDNKFARAAGKLVEGVLPFKRTPANILVRSVEYSPAGLLKSLTADLVKVKQGKMSGAEAIDNISAGLTGTGLMTIGALLASKGLLTGGGSGDENEDKLDDLTGGQDYALEVGGNSYTLDWLAPSSLPVFMGVELYNAVAESGMEASKAQSTLNALIDLGGVTLKSAEPMLEMSMLQSLNDLLTNKSYSDDGSPLYTLVASSLSSYLTQGIPTVWGQLMRTMTDKRYTTYTDKNKPLPDLQYAVGKQSSRLLPGAAGYQQIPYIDAWGREEKNRDLPWRAFDNFLSPGYYSQKNETAVDKEIRRLYRATGTASVVPDRFDKSVTIDGEKVWLDKDQYVKGAKAAGKAKFDTLEKLIGTDAYRKADDSRRAELVQDVMEYGNAVGRMAVTSWKPGESSWLKKAVDAVKDGVDIVDYVSYNESKDADGDGTVTQSEAARALLPMKGLSDAQKSRLWQSANSSWSAEKDPFQGTLPTKAKLTPEKSVELMEEYKAIDRADYSGSGVASQKQTAWSKYLDKAGLTKDQRAIVDDTYKFYSQMPAKVNAYSVETMSAAAQRAWPYLKKRGLRESEFLEIYPIYASSETGYKKADKIRDMMALGYTKSEANEIWSILAEARKNK